MDDAEINKIQESLKSIISMYSDNENILNEADKALVIEVIKDWEFPKSLRGTSIVNASTLVYLFNLLKRDKSVDPFNFMSFETIAFIEKSYEYNFPNEMPSIQEIISSIKWEVEDELDLD